ncbi:putative multiple sugar transport system permease protein [Anaerocolumna jejuensis DSM 15929]|uniref:Xylose transport system permease protein XylH n=1 Tax=Anaerocolumna jejuensis DSM 15929 TaxID=1121322 RepID=A0A1M6ZKJ6_9FIRM|nr:sugar ABC transporter permease [Anaerocolumna jejuensis]SHL30873.1 putative multiple sugar transport system permease protein [Anaerocolumna jejuensis DSM 15929]
MNENNRAKMSLGTEIATMLKSNVRDYAMYIALVLIFIFFGIRTGGLFLSSRNLSDLINQTGYVAVLAIGMTIILIIKHIDLSVGYVAGFLGAVSAILLKAGLNVWLVIPIILCLGIVVGIYQGFLVAKVGVPAFVTTLAGMFIFRGLLSLVTQGTGTIIVSNRTFRNLSNGFIPDFNSGGSIHILTIIIGVIAVILMTYSQFKSRKNMLKYNFQVSSKPIFISKIAFLTLIIIVIFSILAGYKGIPWTAIIVGAVLFIYNFILNKTKLGRYIYGIGGNAEAAELSGVNVRKITFFAFASMSMLAALAGILYTSRLSSATPQAGLGFELDAIASSYIGGVSVNGGIGKVTNTIIGALVIMSLTNGMNLMGVDISFQYIVKGAIFILAVAFDVRTRSGRK